MSSWELEHHWEIVRYLVYYLIEDLVPPELLPGKDVLDFSAGLGDLSAYMAQHRPKSLTATMPGDDPLSPQLKKVPGLKYLAGVSASQIQARLAPESLDLFVARMVFQFPTEEEDRIDVDGMLAQIFQVLRPSGRLIIASHEYTELDRQVQATWQEPLERYFEKLLEAYASPYYEHLAGLIELVQTIGIPPREGVHGQTGFGLKPLMTVDSFIKAGFQIERAAEIEDFTFPVGISRDIHHRQDYYQTLGKKVFAIKRKHVRKPAFANKYERPQHLRAILEEIRRLHPFVTIPIFAVQARKAR